MPMGEPGCPNCGSDLNAFMCQVMARKNAEIGDWQREAFNKAVRSLPVDPDAPVGAVPIVAYFHKGEIIVLEQRGVEKSDTEDENDPAYHNCDAMGCSSVSHVAYRFRTPGDP